MAENPQQYAKLANEGILLGYPVKIAGQHARPDNGVHYHSSIKFFDPAKDHPHAIHSLAQHLPLNPPDAKNTQIEPGQFKDRMGNDVFVLKLKGNSADKIKEHNGKFAHMGFPANYEYTPHISVDKALHDKIKASGAKTAHEAGIEFGPAELKKGPKTLRTYHHKPDTTESVAPDAGDFTSKVDVPKADPLEKGALKNAGIALGMAGALASPTHATNTASRAPASIEHSQKSPYDHKKMLNAISQVESSGGKNLQHKPMSNGQHAFGRYALTPDTIRDTIKSNPDLKAKHAKALALQGDTIHKYMQDHQGLEDLIADRHLAHLESHFKNNPDQVAFGWLNGVRGTNRAKQNGTDFSKHWYTQKVKQAYGK
jgi:hypothetical protein